MLITRDSRIYYGIAIILLLNMVTNTNVFPKKRYLLKNPIKITCYGAIAGIAVFLFLGNLSICNVDIKKILTVLVVFFALMYSQCKTCGQSYQYIAVYRYFIPLLPFFFECTDIKSILIAVAIASALGRIGCMMAGCCYGPLTETDNTYNIEYPDPEQLVNEQNGLRNSKAISTITLEALLQFLMAGLMLTMPRYAIHIYIIGSALLVYLSNKWRDREHNTFTYLGLLVPLLFCWGENKTIPICNGKVNYKVYAVISVLVSLMYSNDINVEMLKKFFV